MQSAERDDKNQNMEVLKTNIKGDQNKHNSKNQVENLDQVLSKTVPSKSKSLRSESPFHLHCRPKEPSREFVAKPIPPNLLSSGSPIKARINGNSNKLGQII